MKKFKALEQLKKIESELVFDLLLLSFERQCFDINEILTKKNIFPHVYELQKKIKYLTKKQVEQKTTTTK